MKYELAHIGDDILAYDDEKDEYVMSFPNNIIKKKEYRYKREIFKGYSKLYEGYCPLCDKKFYSLNTELTHCLECNHHVSMWEVE